MTVERGRCEAASVRKPAAWPRRAVTNVRPPAAWACTVRARRCIDRCPDTVPNARRHPRTLCSNHTLHKVRDDSCDARLTSCRVTRSYVPRQYGRRKCSSPALYFSPKCCIMAVG
jgi:hypothetical protein